MNLRACCAQCARGERCASLGQLTFDQQFGHTALTGVALILGVMFGVGAIFYFALPPKKRR